MHVDMHDADEYEDGMRGISQYWESMSGKRHLQCRCITHPSPQIIATRAESEVLMFGPV